MAAELTPADALYTQVDGQTIALVGDTQQPLVSEFYARFACSEPLDQGLVQGSKSPSEIVLKADDNGIECQWFALGKKPLRYSIDVEKFAARQSREHRFPVSKKGLLNQALGKKTRTIIDLTGGWGADALLLCAQGYQVVVVERHPLMALLLNDAMQRLSRTSWARHNGVHVPQVIEADSIELMSNADKVSEMQADCLYVDPMFPPKRKASAAVNKEMQFLQWLLVAQADALELAQAACASAVKRVVIKRPKHADALLAKPDHRCSGKLVNYDVYLNTRLSAGDNV